MHTAKILFVSCFTSLFLFSDLTRARHKGDKEVAGSHPLESNESLFGKSDVSPIPRRHPNRELNIDKTRQSPGWTPPPIPNISTVPNGVGIPGMQNGGGILTMSNREGIPTMPNKGGVPTVPRGPNLPGMYRISKRHLFKEKRIIDSRQFPSWSPPPMPGATMPNGAEIPSVPNGGVPSMPSGGIPTKANGGGIPTLLGEISRMPETPDREGISKVTGGIPGIPNDGPTVPNLPNFLGIEPRNHPSEEVEMIESRQFPGVSGVTMLEGLPGKPSGGWMPTMPSRGEVPTMPGMPNMPNGGGIPTVPSGGKVSTIPGGMPNMPNNRGNIQPPSSTRAHVLSKSRSFSVNSRKLNSDSRINPTIPGIPGLPNQPDFPSFPEKPKNNTGNMTESEIPGVVIPAYAMKIE